MLKGEKLLKAAKRDYLASKDNANQKKWRTEARDAFDFVAGGDGEDSGQWDKEDAKVLKAQGRPAVTLNKIEPLVEGIVGTEINNRQEATYKPHEPSDSGVAQTLSDVTKWMRDNDVAEEDSDAFRNTIICGMGWTINTMEYDRDPDGRFTVISADPLGFRWDVRARRQNLLDSRWRGYVEEMSIEEFEFQFPDKKAKAKTDIFGDTGPLVNGDYVEGRNDDYDNPNMEDIQVGQDIPAKVFEYQWCELEPIYRVANEETGKLDLLDEETFQKVKAAGKDSGVEFVPFSAPPSTDPSIREIRYVKQRLKRYYRVFISGSVLISEPEPSPWKRGFSMQCITGRRQHNKNTFYGIVRAMKDAQRLTNKFISQAIHQYNSNIKGGVVHEEGAITNIDNFNANLAKPNVSVEVADGALSGGKIHFMTPTPFPNDLVGQAQFFLNAAPIVTGLSDEFIGIAGRDQAIGLEQTRKLSTLTIVAPIFSNYKLYRHQQGLLMHDYIRDYIPPETVKRVVAEINQSFVPQIYDKDTSRFDVHVEDAPLSPSMKSTVFSVLKDFMQFIPPEAAPVYLPEFLKYSPLPAKLVEGLQQAFAKSQEPNPQAQKTAELSLEKLQAEIEKLRADAGLADAKADKAEADIETDKDDIQLRHSGQILDASQVNAQMATQNANKPPQGG